MNKILLLPFIFIFACSTPEKETPTLDTTETVDHQNSVPVDQAAAQASITWRSSLDDSISILLSYNIQDSVIVGEITYENSTPKIPFKVIGTIEPDGNYRLLEFENNGNITHVLTGIPAQDNFKLNRFSTSFRKSFQLNLNRKNTSPTAFYSEFSNLEMEGKYFYQYSESGPAGELSVENLDNKQFIFSIASNTGEPAYNLADVPADTVTITNNSFVYTIPESDNCSFKVSFYNGFTTVAYTNGYCTGWFGMNATVAGIFKKIN